MATTTIRVPVELRDEIAQLADARGTSMVDLVADAVHRLARDDWWAAVRDDLDALGDDDVEAMDEETSRLDGVAADGLP